MADYPYVAKNRFEEILISKSGIRLGVFLQYRYNYTGKILEAVEKGDWCLFLVKYGDIDTYNALLLVCSDGKCFRIINSQISTPALYWENRVLSIKGLEFGDETIVIKYTLGDTEIQKRMRVIMTQQKPIISLEEVG